MSVGLKTSDLSRVPNHSLSKIKNDKAGSLLEGPKLSAGLRAEAFERKMEATQ